MAMGMESLLLGIFVLYVLQTIMAYGQMKAYHSQLKQLRNKGLVAVGTKKGRISRGKVVILVSDHLGNIIEGQVMEGITVLARFKKLKNVEGLNLKDLKTKILGQRKPDQAMLTAITELETHLGASVIL
jgi:glucitol operon activator protein